MCHSHYTYNNDSFNNNKYLQARGKATGKAFVLSLANIGLLDLDFNNYLMQGCSQLYRVASCMLFFYLDVEIFNPFSDSAHILIQFLNQYHYHIPTYFIRSILNQ